MEDRVVPIRKVLEVVAEFDDYGVSCSFVAWELCERETAVRPSWGEAQRCGLIEQFGQDSIMDEPLWRLTAQGRRMLEPQTGPGRRR